MVEDAELRNADRILWHLGQAEKKDAMGLLLHQALEGGSGSLEAVRRFKENP